MFLLGLEKKPTFISVKNVILNFFPMTLRKKLSSNKLNISRLKKAGLKVPTLNEDFKNGTFQSRIYLQKYLKKNEKIKNILEIGCSYGYFLNLLKKNKFKNIYGVEINQTCKNYINQNLKIPCY